MSADRSSYPHFVEPSQPNGSELPWLLTGFGFLISLLAIGFWFGEAGVKAFTIGLLFVAFIVTVLVPRSFPVGIARVAAFIMLVGLVMLVSCSGLPLLVAEALSPVAQRLQDDGGNIGVSINAGWLVVVFCICAAAIIWSVASYFSRSVPKILLAAFVLALASFPIVGVFAQKMAR